MSATTLLSGASPCSLTNFNFGRINPALSAKYSPNLYALLTLRRNRGFSARARAFVDKSEAMWLGYFDDNGLFVGTRMSLALCHGAKTSITCPINLGPLREIWDFWEQYAQDGRCAIDRKHQVAFINDESRWRTNGMRRHCLWCQKVTQVKTVREEVRRVESWEMQP